MNDSNFAARAETLEGMLKRTPVKNGVFAKKTPLPNVAVAIRELYTLTITCDAPERLAKLLKEKHCSPLEIHNTCGMDGFKTRKAEGQDDGTTYTFTGTGNQISSLLDILETNLTNGKKKPAGKETGITPATKLGSVVR